VRNTPTAILILQTAGTFWMLAGAAVLAFVVPSCFKWEGDRGQAVFALVDAGALLCGSCGILLLRRWGRTMMLVLMPAAAIWAVGWLTFVLQNMNHRAGVFYTAWVVIALATLLACLLWKPERTVSQSSKVL
jgi:hypothetical protein